MKKILTYLFGMFFVVGAFAATTMYIGTEQKYIFTSENLAQTIPEFVENDKKQEKMAETYTRIMNQETGAVSVANLFEVCRAGGFNTYRQTGYEQCRAFILKLLENAEQEVDEEFLSGFCPAAYDENGKQQNGLKSIGDQTRIGDFCSSTNIAGGEVVFRKGYNCTCAAYACNPGFQSLGGACVTEYKDANGDCLRKEYTNMTNITKAEDALKFCESKAIRGCKVRNAIRNYGGVNGRLVCNATRDEVDNAKARILDRQDKQIANLKYYDVCRDYKGKTGKQEYCIDKLFSGLDVGLNEAAGLAQLYATEKNGHTIYCDPSHNKKTIDDYFNCSTLDKSVYYTFKFDDTVESDDAKKFKNTVRGISLIYGGKWNGYNISGKCTQDLKNAATKFGMKTYEQYGLCVFEYGIKTDNANLGSVLHTIEGIDNYVFYHEIQLRGSTRLRDNLKQYIKDQGFVVTGFDCDNSYGRIKKRFIEGDDETLTCRLSGTKNGNRYTNQPIDFVFDDLSESKKITREKGESGVACIISGGAYANKNCHGLDQNQCAQVNAKLKAENPKSSGTKWQNGQCVLIDVKEQNMLENGIQIGLSVIALADCATVIVGNAQGVMGCTLAVVEIGGLATELTTGAAMQQRASDFIKIAVACNSRSCAKNTLKTMAGQAITVQDALKSASTAHQIDVQLARLVEYLEPEDLQSEVSANDWDDIVRQLGGDPNDTAGVALKVANKIGFVAQFASLGASAFRLTGRAISKIVSKSSAKGTKALVVVGTHADDVSSAVAKIASHADDAAQAADKAADAARGASAGAKAAGHADDAARGASAGAKAAGNADDAARGASAGAKAAGNADDAARGVSSGASAAGKAQDIIYDAAYFSRNTSGSDDVFRGVDDLVQVNRQNMSAATIRDLMRKAKQYGFECTDCGGDILKFSKSADGASDATRGASAGAKAAEHADDAGRAASKAAKNTNKSKNLDDLYNSTHMVWEYDDASGFYRTTTRYNSMHFDKTLALQDIFDKANISIELDDAGYLILREENIADLVKANNVSGVKHAGDAVAGFMGRLIGWKVDNVELVRNNSRNAVFKFKENSSGKTYYLKHVGNQEEISRTKRAYEILGNNSDVVHTVRVVEDDQDVLVDFVAKNNLHETGGNYWMLTEEVPTSVSVQGNIYNDEIKKALRGKPITIAEQQEIRNAFKKLNNGGIVHGDLYPNMLFMRESNGKLRVDLIDYEDLRSYDKFADERQLDNIFNDLRRANLAE